MKKNILSGIRMMALFGVLAGAAKADNIHLCNVPTGCNSSNAMSFSGNTAYLTGNPDNESLFLAILQPVMSTSGNWHSGTLWTALGVAGGSVYPTLSSAISQDDIATGITPVSFNVSDLNIGKWTADPQTLAIPSEPVGTLIMAFTEDSHGNLDLVTPWSSSFGINGTPPPSTPEPSTVLLFGAVLVGGLLLKRKA